MSARSLRESREGALPASARSSSARAASSSFCSSRRWMRRARVEAESAFKRIRSGGEIAGMLLSGAEKKTRTALRRQQLDGLAKRGEGRGGIFFNQEDAEIERGFGHFGVEDDGALVFGAGVV